MKIRTHPVRISPPWLRGSCTIHEITVYTARKIARAADCRLPRRGWYLVLPASWPWAELHRNPWNPKRPFHVIERR
jgi:hypothetical protein